MSPPLDAQGRASAGGSSRRRSARISECTASRRGDAPDPRHGSGSSKLSPAASGGSRGCRRPCPPRRPAHVSTSRAARDGRPRRRGEPPHRLAVGRIRRRRRVLRPLGLPRHGHPAARSRDHRIDRRSRVLRAPHPASAPRRAARAGDGRRPRLRRVPPHSRRADAGRRALRPRPGVELALRTGGARLLLLHRSLAAAALLVAVDRRAVLAGVAAASPRGRGVPPRGRSAGPCGAPGGRRDRPRTRRSLRGGGSPAHGERPGGAYFSTLARAGELGVGAVLAALAPVLGRMPAPLADSSPGADSR